MVETLKMIVWTNIMVVLDLDIENAKKITKLTYLKLHKRKIRYKDLSHNVKMAIEIYKNNKQLLDL